MDLIWREAWRAISLAIPPWPPLSAISSSSDPMDIKASVSRSRWVPACWDTCVRASPSRSRAWRLGLGRHLADLLLGVPGHVLGGAAGALANLAGLVAGDVGGARCSRAGCSRAVCAGVLCGAHVHLLSCRCRRPRTTDPIPRPYPSVTIPAPPGTVTAVTAPSAEEDTGPAASGPGTMPAEPGGHGKTPTNVLAEIHQAAATTSSRLLPPCLHQVTPSVITARRPPPPLQRDLRGESRPAHHRAPPRNNARPTAHIAGEPGRQDSTRTDRAR